MIDACPRCEEIAKRIPLAETVRWRLCAEHAGAPFPTRNGFVDVWRGQTFRPPEDGDLEGVRIPLRTANRCVSCNEKRDSSNRLVHSDGCPLAMAFFKLPPALEVTGPPMRGKCAACGVDLDELVREGKIGHACHVPPRPATDPDTEPAYEALTATLGKMSRDLARVQSMLEDLIVTVAKLGAGFPIEAPGACGACTLLARAGAGPCDKHAPPESPR